MTETKFAAEVQRDISALVREGECADDSVPAPNADEIKTAAEHDRKAMSPFAAMAFEQVRAFADVSREAYAQGLAEGERIAAKKIARLESAIEDALDLIDGYVDVVDGDYGAPEANKAMQAVQRLEYAMGRRPA